MAASMPGRFCVAGAGTPQANGVFERVEGESHEGRPVYGSLGGYRMSLSCNPEAGSGRLLWGWVIGRAGVPAYACPTEEKLRVPRDAWQCFEGTEPAPEVFALADEDSSAAAYEEEARSAVRRADLQRAASAFDRALSTWAASSSLRSDWARRAALHAARGKVWQAMERFDRALSEADAALALRPDLVPALLLRAQILLETREMQECALSAKQCWAFMTSSVETHDKSLQKVCKRTLDELRESLDDQLPVAFSASDLLEEFGLCVNSDNNPDATEPELGEALGIEVSGCGVEACHGLYHRTGQYSNGALVYESSAGYRLSLEALPVKGTTEVRHGWVLGKGATGLYGARATATGATSSPPQSGWRAFGDAGAPPMPTCSLLRETSATAPAGGSRRLAAHATQLAVRAAGLLAEGRPQAARACAEEALRVWPGCEDGYVQRARALEADGAVAAAAEPLQQLLTMRPKHEGGLAALLELQARGALSQEASSWLRHFREREASPPAETKHCASQAAAPGWRGPDAFEDRPTEAYASWTLPAGVAARDVRVNFTSEHLTISVKGEVLFDSDLAQKVKPSECSWTVAPPDLSVQLAKCMARGAWPRWETLHREGDEERSERLGGLPVDLSKTQWL